MECNNNNTKCGKGYWNIDILEREIGSGKEEESSDILND